jgi:hypothetical protein
MFQKKGTEGYCDMALITIEIQLLAHVQVLLTFLYIITSFTETPVPARNQCTEALCKENLVK